MAQMVPVISLDQKVLGLLLEQGRYTAREIADRFERPVSDIAAALGRLVDGGLIEADISQAKASGSPSLDSDGAFHVCRSVQPANDVPGD